jgi:hypothetical protein
MLGVNQTKDWLEARLGPLPHFVQLMPSFGFFGRNGRRGAAAERPDADRDDDGFAMDGDAASAALARAFDRT